MKGTVGASISAIEACSHNAPRRAEQSTSRRRVSAFLVAFHGFSRECLSEWFQKEQVHYILHIITTYIRFPSLFFPFLSSFPFLSFPFFLPFSFLPFSFLFFPFLPFSFLSFPFLSFPFLSFPSLPFFLASCLPSFLPFFLPSFLPFSLPSFLSFFLSLFCSFFLFFFLSFFPFPSLSLTFSPSVSHFPSLPLTFSHILSIISPSLSLSFFFPFFLRPASPHRHHLEDIMGPGSGSVHLQKRMQTCIHIALETSLGQELSPSILL